MILRLVLASVRLKPLRSALLLAGYGLGVGVTLALLSIGSALLEQSRDRALVGGGDLVALPAGLDLETFRTGGVSSLYFRIDQARFYFREVLASADLGDRVAAAAPWLEDELLYARTPESSGEWVPVAAGGQIPSTSRALGVSPLLTAGAWSDAAADRRWLDPADSALYAEIDAFHLPSGGAAADSTWAEWHYFNVLLPDGWLYLTYMIAGEVPDGRWGGRLLATRVSRRGETVWDRTFEPDRVRFEPGSAELDVGRSSVRIEPDGTYRVRAELADRGGGPLELDLRILAERRNYLPPVELGGPNFASGYVVPLLDARADGSLCLASGCLDLEGAQAYHDHNWGVWRDVTWEWGQANGEDGRSILYGRIVRDGEAVGTGFVFASSADGFEAVLPIRDLAWTWRDAGDSRWPAELRLLAARRGDTLRLRTSVSHVRGTPAGDRAGPGGGATFYQIRGEAELEGRLGGEAVGTRATGFFETWGPPPE